MNCGLNRLYHGRKVPVWNLECCSEFGSCGCPPKDGHPGDMDGRVEGRDPVVECHKDIR